MANYNPIYGAPTSAVVYVDGTSTTLTLQSGSSSSVGGTWESSVITFGSNDA